MDLLYNGFIIKNSMKNQLSYDGRTYKFGITIDAENYIVKYPKNSVTSLYSEYFASRFISLLGIKAHSVWLGTHIDSHNKKNSVVILKDFTSMNIVLHAFKGTRQSSEDTDISNKTYTYDDVLYLISKHTKLGSNDKQRMLVRFWQMFICDAILGNRDRHQGNWGYLVTPKGYKPAPIYDNGASLFPDVERVFSGFTKDEYQFLAERSEKFPASLFQMERADGSIKRTNYYEMFSDLRINKTFAHQVKILKEKVGFEGIYRRACRVAQQSNSVIPSEYVKFYIMIICMRYLHIVERKPLKKAYTILKERMKDG